MELQALKQHGAFSWNELMTTDVSAAKTFYHELLGWELQDLQTPTTTYTIVKTGDREIGGIMAVPPEEPGKAATWGSYVTVDDVDKLVAAASKLGGSVMVPPRDIPGVGRFAVIRDPQGAMLNLITYSPQ